MMGLSHSLSGAAAWLGGSLAAQHLLGYHQTPAQLAVGAAVCAGAALIPDIDMSGAVIADRGGATIARTYGRAGLLVAEVADKVSRAVYRATASATDLRDRREGKGGHRYFWHTLPANAAIGALAWALTAALGRWAVAAVLFLTFAPLVRVLRLNRYAAVPLVATMRAVSRPLTFTRAEAAKVLLLVLPAAAAGVAVFGLPGGRGYPLLGLAVGAGCLVHLAGDWVTRSGVPLRWPLAHRGKRWWMSRMWLPLAIRAGGPVERYGYRPAFGVSIAVAVVVLADPRALTALAHWFG